MNKEQIKKEIFDRTNKEFDEKIIHLGTMNVILSKIHGNIENWEDVGMKNDLT